MGMGKSYVAAVNIEPEAKLRHDHQRRASSKTNVQKAANHIRYIREYRWRCPADSERVRPRPVAVSGPS